MKQIEYLVGSYLLPAIINGDYSGLIEPEITMLQNFLEKETEGIKTFHWNYDPESEGEGIYERCKVTGQVSLISHISLIIM